MENNINEINEMISKNRQKINNLQAQMEEKFSGLWEVKYIVLIILGFILMIVGFNLNVTKILNFIPSLILMAGGLSTIIVNFVISFAKEIEHAQLDYQIISLMNENADLVRKKYDKTVNQALETKNFSELNDSVIHGASKEKLIEALKTFKKEEAQKEAETVLTDNVVYEDIQEPVIEEKPKTYSLKQPKYHR